MSFKSIAVKNVDIRVIEIFTKLFAIKMVESKYSGFFRSARIFFEIVVFSCRILLILWFERLKKLISLAEISPEQINKIITDIISTIIITFVLSKILLASNLRKKLIN